MITGVKRTATVYTSLADGELVLFGMKGRERLGRPYQYELTLLSDNPDIGLSELLGQAISVTLELPNYALREFNGIVTHFACSGSIGRHAMYEATVRPWLWMLSRRVRSRIFQTRTVPDVIQQLLREHGFSDFSNALTEQYRTFEYLVQYRESDLDFLCRIMELEGIYFFFKHKQGKQELVLADSYSAHEPAPGYASVPFYPPQSGERRERDHVDRWRVRRTVRAGVFSARDFNFTRPAAPLTTELRAPLDHAFNEYEVYDYPGQFQDSSEADAQGRVRLEELQADFELAYGAGNARGLGCGGLFELAQFPRADQNKEYLIVEAQYDISVGDYESLDSAAGPADFRVMFVAMESSRPYRPPRTTPQPVVEGPQTATVVGRKGQDIWTDEYGRVRLQFHWDREGESDENSSCWVRVSQAWAGTQWGSIHIPRIGQEVIVDFLEGDPNRPIVTGRVYNADNMPPYALPANQTQSGIKSRSTKGGNPNNFNEIRFEDKKGDEEFHVQAEKNMTTLVKNDQTTTVRGDRSVDVKGQQTTHIGKNRVVTIDGSQSIVVKGDSSVEGVTGENLTCEAVSGASLSITDDCKLMVNKTIYVEANESITFKCGDSSIVMDRNSITIIAGGQASLKLDASAVMVSSAGAKITLDDANDAIVEAAIIKLN